MHLKTPRSDHHYSWVYNKRSNRVKLNRTNLGSWVCLCINRKLRENEIDLRESYLAFCCSDFCYVVEF